MRRSLGEAFPTPSQKSEGDREEGAQRRKEEQGCDLVGGVTLFPPSPSSPVRAPWLAQCHPLNPGQLLAEIYLCPSAVVVIWKGAAVGFCFSRGRPTHGLWRCLGAACSPSRRCFCRVVKVGDGRGGTKGRREGRVREVGGEGFYGMLS
jgi:hypothetical protein